MKKILLLLILSFISTVLYGCSKDKPQVIDIYDKIIKNDKVIVGIKYDTKPFGFIDTNQQVSGFDADLAKYIAKELLGDENKVEFKQATPQNRILALNSSQVDMIIATMTVTPQREEVVNFSIPYYIAGQAIMVEKDSNIKGAFDLKGKKVIIVLGTTADKHIQSFAPEAIIQGYRNYTDAFNALKNKRADAIITDDSILLGLLQNNPQYKILPQRYTKEPYAIALKKGVESEKLQIKINNIIKKMQSNGDLEALKKKWIN